MRSAIGRRIIRRLSKRQAWRLKRKRLCTLDGFPEAAEEFIGDQRCEALFAMTLHGGIPLVDAIGPSLGSLPKNA
jgi:hypothetical protein